MPDMVTGFVKHQPGQIPYATIGNGEIAGSVYELDYDELMQTDVYEGMGYERITTTTVKGETVYMYIRRQHESSKQRPRKVSG